MILLCGIPSEPPLRMVAERLDVYGATYTWFDQRHTAEYTMDWQLTNGDLTGELRRGDAVHALPDVAAVYVRLMDDRILPELAGEAQDSPRRKRCRALHDTLFTWYELAPARVVNRAEPQGTNGSKPYQAQLIARHGFWIPETLITNQPDLVRDFHREHGRVVYKSTSGARSIVKQLTETDLERLDRITWCPVQFQAYVPGVDVRVHTIGKRVFATKVDSEATDYRYASAQGAGVELSEVELSDELAEACLALAADLNLPFAGIDLKITPDGRVYCFEVNPSPAFSYYESRTHQPIAAAVARYLMNS